MKKLIALMIIFSVPYLLKSQNNEIEKYVFRNQYSKALNLCKLNNSNKTDKESLLLIGKIYNYLNMPDSALMFLNKILVEEQDYLYLSEKAISYSLKNNTQELDPICNKLLSICSSSKKSPIRMKIIELFLTPSVNKFDFALNLLNQFQEAESTNAAYYILNAQYLMHSNKVGEAVTEYQRAIFYDSLNVIPYYMIGKIYQKRNLPLSVEFYNKSLIKDSLYYPSYKELGEIYYDLGKNQKAIEYFKKYCDNNVINQKDSLKLASMFLLNKQYADAEVINNTILSSNPNNIFCLRLKAYINVEMDKNIPEGVKSIEKMFSIIDTNLIITSDYEYRGKLYNKLKNDSVAIVNFNLALTKDSSRIQNYEFIAKAYESSKNNIKAAEFYQKSISLKEKPMPSDYFFMGRNYYISGSKPIDSLLRAFPEKVKLDSLQKVEYLIKADTAFSSVIALSPNSNIGYFWKARVKAMFDPETVLGTAMPFYQQALTIMESKPEKFKNEMIESYKYLGYYYFLQFETFNKTNVKEKSEEMKAESLKYWQKILALNPEEKTALEAIKSLTTR